MSERRTCPVIYKSRLIQAGGFNRYETANFRIDWGETYTVRRGGVWESGDYSFRGYRDVLEDGRPCWVLRQWNPPEFYGTPEKWFRENLDPKSGLQLLGDFPWRGQYEAIQPLVWRGLVNSRMVVEHMPLNGMILDILIPLIKKWKIVQSWRKQIAFENYQQLKQRELDSKFEDKVHDSRVPFRGPVSYSRQACRTSLIDRRMKSIEDHWYEAISLLRKQGLGITIH